MQKGDGQEVLVVDRDENVQKGLQQLLTGLDLHPTTVGDPERARTLCGNKFFSAVLVDLDTPGPNQGLALVRWLQKEAPATAVFVLTARKAFEAAVESFRAGAREVVFKAPDQIEYLKERLLEAVGELRASADRDRLLDEVIEVHEAFFKRLLELSRRASELEERLGGGAHSAEADGPTAVLLVEPPDDQWLTEPLRAALVGKGGYHLVCAATGGEALDRASAERFQIALVHKQLPDLPGTMVVSALKAQAPETITILYTHPAEGSGRAEVLEGSRAIELLPELARAEQVVERLDELRRAFTERSRERRYLAAFRQENYELLRRYAELKQLLATRARR
jgi:DNA-binding NtrC family response regulator